MRFVSKYANKHFDARQAVALVDDIIDGISDTDLIQKYLYLEIRYYKDILPEKVGEVVDRMVRIDPDHHLVDDAMAEQVYALTNSTGAVFQAEVVAEKMERMFPEGNALDNALNWIAVAHRHLYGRKNENRIDWEIIQKFPNTRFALYSWIRIFDPIYKRNSKLSGARPDLIFRPLGEYSVFETIAPAEYFEGTNSQSRQFGVLPAGTRVRGKGINSDWLEFHLGTRSGYAYSSYMKCVAGCG